jgi:hypothetical protein
LPDIEDIRRSFTSLSRTGADGRPLVFLDGPGGAQVPDVVIDAMADYLRHSNANIDGAFVTSEETTALVDATRVAAADFLGGTPEEVIFGPNMTTINFNLVHAFCRTLETARLRWLFAAIVLGAPRSIAAERLVKLSSVAFGADGVVVPGAAEERKQAGRFSFRRR